MDSLAAGSSGLKSMSRHDLYSMIQSSMDRTFDKKLLHMENIVLSKFVENDPRRIDVKQKLSMIKHQFKQRWIAANKIKQRFEQNNTDWLKGTIWLPAPESSTSSSGGRPFVDFKDSSDRSKRRKTQDLRNQDEEVLTYATQMKLRQLGKKDAAKVVKDLTKSPRRASKYVKAYKKSNDNVNDSKLSVLDALSMFVEAGLTKAQYERVRETNKSFFPCYSILQKAKIECYPVKEAIQVTETCSEVKIQELMNHTASRIIMHIQDAIPSLTDEERSSLILISKWGCDGSQQAQFKMKFENETDSDANIFQTSVVPLRLYSEISNKIIWQNPCPSSARYCRPIRLRFVKESTDITNQEIDYIKHQIQSLSLTEYQDTRIKHNMLFTMVDGKVCNAATHTKSTTRCYICDATSKEFNNLTIRRDSKKENLSFGLSLLHARIRFFESLLHVAYKLPVRKWNVRLTPEEKSLVASKKKDIQERFRKELGLLVDMPKSNFGNTNDGNTSRRFFENYEISADITEIDKDLIYRLKIILDALTSSCKINKEKFEKYADETAKMYVNLYGFYPMSPTLHKVLRHGAEVIEDSILPIGQLSEEAAEARNKHIRNYRLNYSRKFSRIDCNVDVLNRLLLTSDPLISGMRKITSNKKPLLKDVKDLLEDDSYNIENESFENK